MQAERSRNDVLGSRLSSNVTLEKFQPPLGSSQQTAEEWEHCARILAQHSEEMVQRWKSEIDMLLVFAGLFSAVLTAFNVQSYQLLQPDEQGEMLAALATISAQLNGFTYSPPFINSTFNHIPGAEDSFAPPVYAVWLNSLWFSALICTLSASSIAIMVRQWLHQYSSGLTGTSREVARLRQFRYESLIKWRVAGIVMILPVLLQLALILFLVGLLILLWTIHPRVALTASVLVGILLFFTVTVTVIPAFRTDCPYQAPAALCFFRVSQYLGGFIRLGLVAVDKAAYNIGVWRSRTIQNICWTTRRAVRRALRFQGTWGMFNTWEVRERHETHGLAPDLDFSLLEKVYEITLDDHLLETTIARCLESLDPAAAVRGCVEFLHRNTTVHDLFSPGDPNQDDSADVLFAQGRRRACHQTFLLTQVLALVPKSTASIRPSTRRLFEEVTWKLLALLPPKVVDRTRYISYGGSEQGFDSALVIRALASLVSHDFAPAESFLKLIINVRHWFDVPGGSGGHRVQTLDMDVLQQVIGALPATYQEVLRRIDWQSTLLAEYYFAAVTSIIHAILRNRSTHHGSEDACTEALLQRVMASVEALLSHPSWKASPDTRSQVMRAVCNTGSHSWRTNARAFLPTLSHLAANFSSREATDPVPKIVTPSLLRIVHQCLETYGQAQLLETPELVRVHHQLGMLSTRTTSMRSVDVLQCRGENEAPTSTKLHDATCPSGPHVVVQSSPKAIASLPIPSSQPHPIASEITGERRGPHDPELASLPTEDPSTSPTLLDVGLAVRMDEDASISFSV